MGDLKEWYTDKKGKYILFFGFYIIFFIIFGALLKNAKDNRQEEVNKDNTEVQEKISTYDITKLINNNYQYEIVIEDEDDIITFKGSKDSIDYGNYTNKFFLDIYNINQLLKRSKFVENNENILTYELSNSELNDLLVTEKGEGANKIDVYVNDNGEVNRITMDLKEYLEKKQFVIDINYSIGENNENSAS